MDEYVVSARKYRPDSFDSVVGQDAITQTLKNSIINNQLGQAYLFCGPRGVGKTTCARIFAKIINCSNPTADHEPCNECESCKSFNQMRSLNIHELDAASNNSVEDIRSIIDQVRIPPQLGSYSVYIIDEVHMLSSAAFNAFLKTLEEPPKHVIFILATTEKHKILPTILSRCQIFDFNRISVEDIRQRLQFVATREGITAEHDALHIIAQKADGAMRDALSIFDQIVSFCGKNITYRDTIKNLNVLDYEVYFQITDAVLTGNYAQALIIFDNVLKKGFEGSYFINGLASHYRDLLVCKDPGTIELIEVGNKIKEKYMEHAQKCSVSFLFKAIQIANTCDLNYKTSQNKRLLIELALLALCDISTKSLSGNAQVSTPNVAQPSSPVTTQQTKVSSEPQNILREPTPKMTAVPIANPKKEGSVQQNQQVVVAETLNAEPEKKPADKESVKPSMSSIVGLSSLTISGITNEIKKEETDALKNNVDNVDMSLGLDDYTLQDLQASWIKFSITINEPRWENFFKNHLPYEKSADLYEVAVETKESKSELDRTKGKVVTYIRENLNNRNIKIDYIVDENLAEKTVKSIKTETERLQEIIDENANIKTLLNEGGFTLL